MEKNKNSKIHGYEEFIRNYTLFEQSINNLSSKINKCTIISKRNKFVNNLEKILNNQTFIENISVIENNNHYFNQEEKEKLNFTIDIEVNDKNEIEISFMMKNLSNYIYDESNEFSTYFSYSYQLNSLYDVNNFTYYQKIITYLFTKLSNNLNIPKIKVYSTQLIFHNNNSYYINTYVLFVIHIIFNIQFYLILNEILKEKENHLYELLKMQRITIILNYKIWVLIYFFNSLFIISISIFINSLLILKNIKLYIILFVIILYNLNEISFVLFTSFVEKKNTIQFYI